MSIEFANGDVIAPAETPYVVAEINTGHFGDMEKCRLAITLAAEAGADCIKFQSWSPRSLYSQKYLDDHKIEARMFERFSLTSDNLQELATYALESGIAFASTPYTKDEIDALVEMPNVPFIKIASMDLNNPDLLRHAASRDFPIVLSTGMADLKEIERARGIILDRSAKPLIALHCTSLYPTPDKELNLLNIRLLQGIFGDSYVGYSDHSTGSLAASLASGLGAVLIEKHFTLDKKKPGFDNAMALDPTELSDFVHCLEVTTEMLGTSERVLSEAELGQRISMRRSLHASRFCAAGEEVTPGTIEMRRPGNGIPPDKAHLLIGKRFANDVAAGQILDFKDIV
jgi:sialic acid synthase SpsE